MATTYDNASLVMIPSGVKEDKLYSIKPTDGSGDFTFSRGSDIEATRVNSSGLIEKAKVNNLLQSNQFDTTWTLGGGTLTSGQTGYDGSNDAWLFTYTSGAAIVNQPNTQSGVQTYSVYAKGSAANGIRLYAFGSANANAYFDLNIGEVETTGNIISASIEDKANGWYRCSITFDQTNTNLYMYLTGNNNSSAGSGSVLIQDAQLNHGLIAQDYVETTTTAVVEGLTADLPRLDYSGGASCPSLLLEPSRTNLIEQSDYLSSSFWFDDDITRVQNTTDTLSPEGAYNAVKLTETATSARHRLASNTITITNSNYSASVFLKKGTARYGFVHLSGAKAYTIVVDLEDGTITDTATNDTIVHQSVEDYGNGWYRCSVAGNMAAVTTAYIVQFGTAGSATPSYSNYVPIFLGSTSNNIYAYGAQLEAGSYPTSYIPTYGTAANRGSETPSINPSALVGATEGSWFVNFADMSFDISGTSGPSIFIGYNQSNYLGITNRSVGNVTQVLFCKRESGSIANLHTIVSQSGNEKFCFTWNGSNLKLFVNGVKVYDDNTFANFISWVQLNMGNAARTPQYDNKQTLLFPTQLTDAECIALTTI